MPLVDKNQIPKAPPKPTIAKTEETVDENSYVEAIQDAIVLISCLEKFCKDFDEMLHMLHHAIENPAQLRLLMKNVSEK